MFEIQLGDIATAVNGTLIQGEQGVIVQGIATDSRKVKPGDLFIALRGKKFDGHHFLETAVKAGAIALLVMDEAQLMSLKLPVAIIKAADTLTAFGALARNHRRQYHIPLIAITGSNGKTTTKDLAGAVLAGCLAVVKTEANFNNEIGLPMTLLQINHQTQAAIVEMGMRGMGQIRQLAGIAEPNIAMITNVGLTHLELLGTQENIARAKTELVEALPENGLAILNGDDPYVRKMQGFTRARSVLYGIETAGLDYQAGEIKMNDYGSTFQVYFKGQTLDLSLPIPGRHNILNAMAVVALGHELGLPAAEIRKGLANPDLTGKRLKITEHNGYSVIDDTYNASPASVKAALDVLVASTQRGRKIAVLADMLELGPSETDLHREVGVYAGSLGVDKLLAWGELASEYATGMNDISEGKGEYFSTKPALIEYLKQFVQPGDIILVKGSRGMKMEEVVEVLLKEETESWRRNM